MAEIMNDIRTVLLCVIAGFGIALVIMYYCKMIAGKSIRLLFEQKAFSPENAKSLEELGLGNIAYHKKQIEEKSPQKAIAAKTEDGKYYIREEQKDRAERTYTTKENALGMTVVSLIITAGVFFGVYFAWNTFAEKIETAIDFAKESDIGGQKTSDGGFVYETDDMGHVKDENYEEENEEESEEETNER